MAQSARELELREVGEADAPPEVTEVYGRIKETLRVSVVNFVWRVFATKPAFLRGVWDQLEPAVDEGFMQAAEGIRALAIERVRAATQVPDHRSLLGDDLFQAVQELRVFMEVNPRLLVLMCALRRSWEEGEIGGLRTAVPTERGVPSWQPQVEEGSPSGAAKRALKEIVEVLDLPAPNTDYRVLAKWPEYFPEAWGALRTFVGTDGWRSLCETVHWVAEEAALALPAKVHVARNDAGALGLQSSEEVEEATAWIETFHRLLPGLIANTSYLWVGLRGGSERETPVRGTFERSEQAG